MINFLQVPPVEPQPGFMQQYSFIIMIGLMVLVLWLFMWRPESKRRKQMQACLLYTSPMKNTARMPSC